jgi:hypothetical protein
MTSATDSIAAFLDGALNRAERRREPIEVTISKPENAITIRSVDPSFVRRLEIPEGVHILRVLPELPIPDDLPRMFMLHPGGSVPRIGVELANRRGMRRIVSVDPISGSPQVQTPEQP